MRKIAYWISLLFIFTIPWEVVLQHPVLGSISKIVGAVLAIAWIMALFLSRRVRKPNFFHALVVIFILWNAASIFWSGDPSRTLGHIATWAQLFMMVYILWDLYRTEGSVRTGLQFYVFGAYFIFANTLQNYLSGTTYYYERFSATSTNPDDLALILALGIHIAAYLAMPDSKRKMSPLLRIINYAFIPAAFLGIALSGTRAALIAAVPGLVFLVISLSRIKLYLRFGVFLLILVLSFAVFPLIPQASIDRLSTVETELAGGQLNGRMSLWVQGLATLSDNPLTGVGSYMYRSVNTENKVAHNSFLSVLIELGLVGLTLFLFILGVVAVKALAHPRLDALFWSLLLFSWAIGANSLTWEYRKPTWLILALVVASAAAVKRPEKAAAPQLAIQPEAQAL